MVVLVVELVSLEGVVGEETVGARQELRSWSHLTAATENKEGFRQTQCKNTLEKY